MTSVQGPAVGHAASGAALPLNVTSSTKSARFVTQIRKHLTKVGDAYGTIEEAGGVGGRLSALHDLQGSSKVLPLVSEASSRSYTALPLTSTPDLHRRSEPCQQPPGSGCSSLSGLPMGYRVVSRQAQSQHQRRSQAQGWSDTGGLPTRRSGVRAISDPGELWSSLLRVVVTPPRKFLHTSLLKAQVRGAFASPILPQKGARFTDYGFSTQLVRNGGGVVHA